MKGKKELILQTVLKIFMENGISGLKVSTIASRAEIGKGTVYEYFSSKEDLFISAIDYGMEQLGKTMEEKMSLTVTFKESFDNMVDCIAEVAQKSPLMSFTTELSNMPFTKNTIARIRETLQKTHRTFTNMLTVILEKGQKEGIIKSPESPEYVQAMLLLITNMTMKNVHFGTTSLPKLKIFYYEACLKLFS